MSIEAVLFDLGDTLLNFGKVDVDELFRRGAALTYDYLAEHHGADALGDFEAYRRSNIISIKLHYSWAWLSGQEFDCVALLDRRLRRLGLKPTPAQLEELSWLWYQPLGETAILEPNLHEHLQRLTAAGLKLAIVSNTFVPPQTHDRQLHELDLLQYFPVRQYSSATVFRKPDRRIFRDTLRQLQVAPQAAVMIGDKYGPDIRGALRAGIHPIYKRGVTNQSRRIPSHIRTISNIGELTEMLAGWDR